MHGVTMFTAQTAVFILRAMGTCLLGTVKPSTKVITISIAQLLISFPFISSPPPCTFSLLGE